MAVPGSVELSEIASGTLFVAAQQQLRKFFPQLQNVPTWVMSIIWAVVSVLIISYEWTPNAGGGGVLTITVPSLAAAIMGLWKLGEQFALNEILYGGNEILQGTSGARVKSTAPAVPPASAPVTPQPYPSQPPLPPSKYSVPEAQK